jgi:hypothetical protein
MRWKNYVKKIEVDPLVASPFRRCSLDKAHLFEMRYQRLALSIV